MTGEMSEPALEGYASVILFGHGVSAHRMPRAEGVLACQRMGEYLVVHQALHSCPAKNQSDISARTLRAERCSPFQ